jgi:hypothetical protein
VFVVPNPSGRNAAYPGFRDKLSWYRRLARYVPAPVALERHPGVSSGGGVRRSAISAPERPSRAIRRSPDSRATTRPRIARFLPEVTR